MLDFMQLKAICGIEVIKVLLRTYKNVCEFPVWMIILVLQEVSFQ